MRPDRLLPGRGGDAAKPEQDAAGNRRLDEQIEGDAHIARFQGHPIQKADRFVQPFEDLQGGNRNADP